MAAARFHTLRLLLGDQLHAGHSWFRQPDPGVCYVLMEVRPEQEYVWHHVRKIQLFFAAMRAFAAERAAEGHALRYFRISDADNRHDFAANCDALIAEYGITRFEYQLPDEYRLDVQLAAYADALRARGLLVAVADTEHFYTTRRTVGEHFGKRKQWLMERFYRHMRQEHGILMDDEGPAGGQWNYDAQNRNPPPGPQYAFPPPLRFDNDFRSVDADIAAAGLHHFGQPLPAGGTEFPVTRQQALQVLAHFVQQHLPRFGTFQDAMLARNGYLHHSLLSFALNVKLLRPHEVVAAAEAAYRNDPATYALPHVEGFIRQILGWREYVRGIYWARMPAYAATNHLQAHTPLPQWYWTGDTRMRCLHTAVRQSLDTGYAHHIQRLMVTGNFATLIGARPAEINAWYLGIYVDAIEWVQLPNTHGMSQFADGGLIATKPYVSGAAYVNRMSDYCAGCAYSPRIRHGARACPFNSLYWHFLHRHRDQLGGNFRMKMMYANWDKQGGSEQQAVLRQAEHYLATLDTL